MRWRIPRPSAGRIWLRLVQLVLVLLLVAILARVSLPVYHAVALRVRTASAVTAIDAVRDAARSYNAATGQWPADARGGVVPPELRAYLGEAFRFDRRSYRLDWENWHLPDGRPDRPDATVVLGVSIATENAALGQALRKVVGDSVPSFTLGDRYTFILAPD